VIGGDPLKPYGLIVEPLTSQGEIGAVTETARRVIPLLSIWDALQATLIAKTS
jgi:hypothetical protein